MPKFQLGVKKPRDNAEREFAPKQGARENDGTASANPRVLSENEDGDATFPIKKGTPSE